MTTKYDQSTQSVSLRASWTAPGYLICRIPCTFHVQILPRLIAGCSTERPHRSLPIKSSACSIARVIRALYGAAFDDALHDISDPSH